MAPAGATKVNLPTWAWLDGAEFKPVSVTASVEEIGISATATAEPVSLQIKPGTPDAETYPAWESARSRAVVSVLRTRRAGRTTHRRAA
ncbi:hypothetical protein STENM327S_06935 [Streptomyces tendae]